VDADGEDAVSVRQGLELQPTFLEIESQLGKQAGSLIYDSFAPNYLVYLNTRS
jgi:hypothetical protein